MLLIDETRLAKVGKTNEELKIDLACWLYEHDALSWGRAADFCGLDKFEFWGELDKRGWSVLDEEYIIRELREIGSSQPHGKAV